MRWLRLNQISQKKRPEFIDDGAETNDVIQGAIGDCWFIGAMSVLATEDAYIRGSFDPDNNEDGEISDKAFVPQLVFPVCELILNEMLNIKRVNSFFILKYFTSRQ